MDLEGRDPKEFSQSTDGQGRLRDLALPATAACASGSGCRVGVVRVVRRRVLHGGVAAAALATPLCRGYTSETFNERDTPHGVNQAVVLTGAALSARPCYMPRQSGTPRTGDLL